MRLGSGVEPVSKRADRNLEYGLIECLITVNHSFIELLNLISFLELSDAKK